MERPEIPRIEGLTLDCQSDFTSLKAAASGEGCRAVDFLHSRDIQQLQDRFNQWAGNLGALQPFESPLSLEHRLRNAPIVRESILRILTDLHETMQAATDIALGKRQNRISEPFFAALANIDLSEYDLSSSESDLSSVPSREETDHHGSTSEMQTLISAMDTSLGSLFKASIFIRSNTTRGKRLRAESTKPFDNRADIMYINDRYPSLNQNATLVGRLGEVNARRRQYFKYRRDHDERLSTVAVKDNSVNVKTQPYPEAGVSAPDKTISTVETKPSLLADTEATAFVADEAAQKEMLTMLEAPKAMSEVSFATSIADISDEDFSFPSVPVEAENGTPFLCPYCFQFQKLKREGLESYWRKHVLQDLEPYVCTFSSCSLDTFRSQHAWFEHELLAHRCRWVCSECSTDFRSSHDLKEHVGQHHHGLISKQQLSAFLEKSKRSVESIRPSECPFCDDSWARADSSFVCSDEALFVKPDQFRRHVGKHLEQVALFSLPRLIQDQGKSLGPQNGADFRDRDDFSMGYRWVRDDCGKGWSIVSRKRTTFSALAYFLDSWQTLGVSHIPAGNTEGPDVAPLVMALRQDKKELVLQQLSRGIDVNTQRERFGYMLWLASRSGYTEVVRSLLDQGVNVNAWGINVGSALQVASNQGHGAIVGLLLDQGADVNMDHGRYGSALQAASYRGHTTIVQQLLDRGAEINAICGTGIGWHQSALQAASIQAHGTIVQLLLDRGADINAQGGKYGTALQAACYGGTADHEAVVRMLLDQGAEMNVQVGEYGNALQVASYEGHETIVRLLLDRGMDVNIQGGYFGNALQAAVYLCRDEIVQLLLAHGADVNVQGGHFKTALQAAQSSWIKPVNMMQILLDHGADPIGLDPTKYALVTTTASTMDQNTYTDQRFVIRLQDSVGHLKDQMIDELPEVRQTLAANPTWSAMLVYGDEVLVDESRSCREARIENGSRLLCRINPGPNSDK
ncbi:ankyrin repeat-containing domain protein [Usnea florida]